MTQLILTEDQAKVLRGASGLVQICDAKGNVLGHARLKVPLDQMDPQDRAAVENYLRRRNEPREKGYSGQQVQAMFRALEQEWERMGGFDEAHRRKFLERWQAENSQ